jgi:ribosomal protein S18 acetylase RimI-like enzyme
MEIRNYVDSDYPQLKELLDLNGLYYDPSDNRDNLARKIDSDADSILIAEDSGSIIGTTFLVYDPWASFIFHVGVHPDYQRQGVGDRLMEEAELRLKSKGMTEATLYIESSNHGVVEFYQKRGWKIWGDIICMDKQL